MIFPDDLHVYPSDLHVYITNLHGYIFDLHVFTSDLLFKSKLFFISFEDFSSSELTQSNHLYLIYTSSVLLKFINNFPLYASIILISVALNPREK